MEDLKKTAAAAVALPAIFGLAHVAENTPAEKVAQEMDNDDVDRALVDVAALRDWLDRLGDAMKIRIEEDITRAEREQRDQAAA